MKLKEFSEIWLASMGILLILSLVLFTGIAVYILLLEVLGIFLAISGAIIYTITIVSILIEIIYSVNDTGVF